MTTGTAVKFQLGWTGEHENPVLANRLTIPYLTDTLPWHIKYRSLGEAKNKYTYDGSGTAQHLFNTQTLLTARRAVVVEGELDAISAEQVGVSAVGYPGANTWQSSDHWPAVFDSCESVTVVADGDEAGVKAAEIVSRSLRSVLPDLEVAVVVMPDGMDSNSFIQRYGAVDYVQKVGWA